MMLRVCSLLTQEVGFTTVRVMSRMGRITRGGHIMTIVRNLLGEQATNNVGRIRMLTDDKAATQVSTYHTIPCHMPYHTGCKTD